MNFFERQQVARRNTRWMVGLFIAAVICIVIAVDFVASLAFVAGFGDYLDQPGQLSFAGVPPFFHVCVVLLTVGAIFVVSAIEMSSLRRGGGAAVAALVNARRVNSNTPDPLERRLINVVEEMAIASGTRVPAVYVMDDEKGINAFAAGYDISNSIVAVTRGTLETLNRDELQGVIGHEFSHITNGDMSLNIRMIGVLAGIVFLGAAGEFILRSLEGKKGKQGGALVILGFGLMVIGYIGLFFARLIKAAVSREREFLADAASVQFTRNPDGIAGALDQIRASAHSSLVGNRHAEDVAHLFFGQGIAMRLGGLLATHPPLDERIRRISPRFQSSGYRGKRPAVDADIAVPEAASGFAAAPFGVPEGGARAGDVGQAWGRTPAQSVELVGTVDEQKVDAAKRLLAAIPTRVRDRLHEPQAAAATVVAMLLANQDQVRQEQITAAKTAGVAALAEVAESLAAEVLGVGPAYFLPVLDLALPALKQATPEQQSQLLTALQAVIHADRRVSMFEFVVFTLVHSQITPRRSYAPPRAKSLAELHHDVSFVLALVAHAGCRRGPNADTEVEAAFQAGIAAMGIGKTVAVARGQIGLNEASKVLDRLRGLAPMPKAILVKGLFATVTNDGQIRVIEAALMRMVGAVLECPLPPMLEELDPASLAA